MEEWSWVKNKVCIQCQKPQEDATFAKKIVADVLPNGICIGTVTIPTYFHPNHKSVFCSADCASTYYIQHGRVWDDYTTQN